MRGEGVGHQAGELAHRAAEQPCRTSTVSDETILITDLAYTKGEEVFRTVRDYGLQRAPQEELALAEMVLATGSRAVILGAQPYTGPLYEALGRTGGARGAILARFGVGHDGVDKRLARQHHIVVTNTPGVLEASVAEHALWLIGCLVKQIPPLDAVVRSGQFLPRTGTEVYGKTLGIVGFGAIGRRLGAIGRFGLAMRVLAADCRRLEDIARALGRSAGELLAAWGLDLYTTDADEVFRQADVISLHLPATPETRHFVDARRLSLMKPGALLINTARGSVVDEIALYDALAAGRLGGAALDVFEHEPYHPLDSQKDLRRLENVVLTPHTASNTHEANRAMAQAALANVIHFLTGQMDRLTRVDQAG